MVSLTTYDHCLHERGVERICCWCAGVQHQVSHVVAGHGPYAHETEWKWEPKMAGLRCEARIRAWTEARWTTS
jgi:hypothetical protein